MRKPDPGPRALTAILEEERGALLSGDFARLSALVAEREAAMSNALPSDADSVTAIRKLAESNRRLALAAATGLKDAHSRLAAALDGEVLETYSASGKRRKFEESRPRIQLRA